jgi:hypothetical protein
LCADPPPPRIAAVEDDDCDRVVRKGEPAHLIDVYALRLQDEDAGCLDCRDPGFQGDVRSTPTELGAQGDPDQCADASGDGISVLADLNLRNRRRILPKYLCQLAKRFSLFSGTDDCAVEVRRPMPSVSTRHPAEVAHRLEVARRFGQKEDGDLRRSRAPSLSPLLAECSTPSSKASL